MGIYILGIMMALFWLCARCTKMIEILYNNNQLNDVPLGYFQPLFPHNLRSEMISENYKENRHQTVTKTI